MRRYCQLAWGGDILCRHVHKLIIHLIVYTHAHPYAHVSVAHLVVEFLHVSFATVFT